MENHFQTDQIIQDTNRIKTLATEKDHQTKEIHVISHKTDIVDQIVEVISVEITIRDQTQTEQNILLIPVFFHTLGKYTIPMIDQ